MNRELKKRFSEAIMSNHRPKSSFDKHGGLSKTVEFLIADIQELYLTDGLPWVVGYSGGKDSTAVLQLIWLAITELKPEQRTKSIHVISTDTLVENPIVSIWVNKSHLQLKVAAERTNLPFVPHQLLPEVTDTFWVNLIGRGYPAPNKMFRWCTARLKINPSNKFINELTQDNRGSVLVLGTRKSESATRGRSMLRHEKGRVRDRLSPNSSLPGAHVYSPIEDWTNDDVWTFLMQVKNPWGFDNKALLTMYQGATEGGECPLVVDTTTQSCGDSRFGCWVCTLVTKDRSMQAMINNDEEKQWMQPLIDLREELAANDRSLRDWRKMDGRIQLKNRDEAIRGPYLPHAREMWLSKILSAEKWIHENGPEEVRQIELITISELERIRDIWLHEKKEIEDNLPRIYKEIMGVDFPGMVTSDTKTFSQEDLHLLREVTGGNELMYELVRNLLTVESNFRSMTRRTGLFAAIESEIERCYYDGEQDAVSMAKRRKLALEAARSGDGRVTSSILNRTEEGAL
ncbi:DNA phosphorothioation system sulfurtransferase DndC [Geomonas nitrogeniifigens]|uniref:DNA phosphorothioation system sulfurtransferase DndC n=1 Tax=Geomonas diazotrophica TaxID=2843197 RepID=A0ABX8JLL3_9BACT|nr:DNA phosphorothioation system sulfurtransferase DndC [Geomonas nitrogeniifigens]QWV98227.1 DNA phosphorothioation system sulfurtransferase DndC [Geomonas nitrogeniifigens]